MAQNISKVGKYTIKGRIAEGGMGAIYKAKHPTLNIDVILKKLTLKQNSSILERFKREAQIMIEFRDDHIVQVYDHFKEGRSFYIAMEYVDGIDLGKLIEKERYLPNEMALIIFLEVAKALKYAHAKGVIHRDIKPENVLISKNGEVKLTDFGIATSEEVEDKGLTRNTTLGTPAYMSPEQISSTKDVDKRTDIYSMGVVLYEMVTGKCPFPGAMTPEAILQIQKGKYLSPRKINPNINSVIISIIKKTMHCKAKKRYADLQIVVNKLTRILKKYRTQERINNAIKEYVYSDQVKSQEKTRKQTGKGKKNGNNKKPETRYRSSWLTAGKIFFILLITCAIGLGGTYAYLTGMHHKFLKSSKFGKLSIDLKIPVTDKKIDDHYIHVDLLKLNNKKFKKIENVKFTFRNLGPVNKSGFYLLQLKPVQLATGYYRLYINIENELLHSDFFLLPYSELAKENKSYANLLQFTCSPAQKLPISFNYKVYDVANGLDISRNCEVAILYRGQWVNWETVSKFDDFGSFFYSGKVFRFRVKCDNYYSKYFRIFVKPFQSSLLLHTDLVPYPGRLLLKASSKDFQIYLNNSEHYFSGLKNRKYKRLPAVSTGYKKMFLSPAKYYLTVKSITGVSKTVALDIQTNKILKVYIKKNNNTFDININ